MRDFECPLTPHLMLHAYANGIFPMARSRKASGVVWVVPSGRGVLPLDGFHTSRSLERHIRKGGFRITIDQDFAAVVAACADAAIRPDTWINAALVDAYEALFRSGHAHSLEVWGTAEEGQRLVGGVFGVALGSAFLGESMFSAATNGSKIALYFLVKGLREANFTLFDTQLITPHLASLGAYEIRQEEYLGRLAQALKRRPDFSDVARTVAAYDSWQRSSQTS